MGRSRVLFIVVFQAALWLTASCNAPPEGVMGTELRHGSVGVQVSRYELRYVEFQAENGAVLTTQDPLLLIFLTVTNYGPSTVRYDTRDSVTAAQQAQTPLLFVDPGEGRKWQEPQNVVALTSPGPYRYLNDPVTTATVIAPGESIEDVLLFECPDPGTTSLVLSLPPSLFGPNIETPAIIRISYAPPTPVGPRVGSVGEEIAGDGYVFRLDSAEVTYLPNREHTGFTEAPVLAVRFTARNASEQALIYRPAHREATGVTAPALAAGDHFFDRVRLSQNQQIEGQLVGAQTVPPNAEIEDMAVFERPDEAFSDLVFFFRGHNLGRTGQIRVRLPYTFVDPPLPEELQELPPPVPDEAGETPEDQSSDQEEAPD